jgi:hypothetical protein
MSRDYLHHPIIIILPPPKRKKRIGSPLIAFCNPFVSSFPSFATTEYLAANISTVIVFPIADEEE